MDTVPIPALSPESPESSWAISFIKKYIPEALGEASGALTDIPRQATRLLTFAKLACAIQGALTPTQGIDQKVLFDLGKAHTEHTAAFRKEEANMLFSEIRKQLSGVHFSSALARAQARIARMKELHGDEQVLEAVQWACMQPSGFKDVTKMAAAEILRRTGSAFSIAIEPKPSPSLLEDEDFRALLTDLEVRTPVSR